MYKCSYSGPYLLCIHSKASKLLLKELHEGVCVSHTRERSLSHKAITQRYWWSGMQEEAQEYVKKCNQCQRFAPNIHQPRGVLNPLSSPWPFAQWGLHIICHFPKAAVMQRRRVEAESVTHNYYNSSTKPKFYKNTRLAGKIIEKTSLTNFY